MKSLAHASPCRSIYIHAQARSTQLAKVTQDVTARDQTITQLQQNVKALESAAMKSETPKVEAAKPAELTAPELPAQPEKSEESPQST